MKKNSRWWVEPKPFNCDVSKLPPNRFQSPTKMKLVGGFNPFEKTTPLKTNMTLENHNVQ